VRDDDVQSLQYFAIPNVDISHACFSPTPGCNNVVVETMLQSTSGKLTLNMIGERRFPWSNAVFTALYVSPPLKTNGTAITAT
jgi:hypothetical protein